MIRQAAAPNGSEASPMSPSSKNVAEIPRTVSAPNHVAKTIAKTIRNGRFLPALIKSSAVFVFLEKYSLSEPITEYIKNKIKHHN